MAHIRRRTMRLLLALLAAVSISLALPSLTFAEGGPHASTEAYTDAGSTGSRCQCGWK